MIGAAQNVQEPELHEPQRRLVPAWIEPHQARIAWVLEGALGTGRRLVAKHSDHAEAKARERRMN